MAFYSNYFNKGEGYANSTFSPHDSNPYYRFSENLPVYTDQGNTRATSITKGGIRSSLENMNVEKMDDNSEFKVKEIEGGDVTNIEDGYVSGTLDHRYQQAVLVFHNSKDNGIDIDINININIFNKVAGLRASKTKEFDFEITLCTDENMTKIATDVNGEYGDVKFNNGVAKFKLKHGDTINISGALSGSIYYYKVVEKLTDEDMEKYIVESNAAEGKLEDEETITVDFVNHSKMMFPEVGVRSISLAPIMGGLLLFLAYFI